MKNLHTFITPMGLLPWILALELDRVPVVNLISCIRQTKAFRVSANSFTYLTPFTINAHDNVLAPSLCLLSFRPHIH